MPSEQQEAMEAASSDVRRLCAILPGNLLPIPPAGKAGGYEAQMPTCIVID